MSEETEQPVAGLWFVTWGEHSIYTLKSADWKSKPWWKRAYWRLWSWHEDAQDAVDDARYWLGGRVHRIADWIVG